MKKLEDELLIQSWLNISKDPIVGIDQRGDSFYKRFGEAYKNYRDKNFPERKPTTLKGHWHKNINTSVNKFVGFYKYVATLKKAVPPRATSFRLQKIFFTKTYMNISHLRMHGDYWKMNSSGMQVYQNLLQKEQRIQLLENIQHLLTHWYQQANTIHHYVHSVKRQPKGRKKISLWRNLPLNLMLWKMIWTKNWNNVRVCTWLCTYWEWKSWDREEKGWCRAKKRLRMIGKGWKSMI